MITTVVTVITVTSTFLLVMFDDHLRQEARNLNTPFFLFYRLSNPVISQDLSGFCPILVTSKDNSGRRRPIDFPGERSGVSRAARRKVS